MGGNKSRTPEIITPDYPKDDVKGIIDEAGTRIRENTKKLEDKAQRYRDESDADSALLGMQTAGYAPTTEAFTSYGGVKGAKNFVDRGRVGGKNDKFGVGNYNTINDYRGADKMFSDFQNIYKGEKGVNSPYKSVQQALRVAENKGFVDDGSKKGFGTEQAQGLYKMLASNVKGSFGNERKSQTGDPGAETLTGQTMSQAMGGYRDNFQGTTGDMTQQGRNFIDNYESGLLKSKSFNQSRNQAKDDNKIFVKSSDRYRKEAVNVMNKAKNQALGDQQKTFNQGMEKIVGATNASKNLQNEGFNKASELANSAFTKGTTQMDSAVTGANTSISEAETSARDAMDTATTGATTNIDSKYTSAKTDIDTARTTASTEALSGYTAGSGLISGSATTAYEVDKLDGQITQQGTRATEGYEKYDSALEGAGTSSKTFTSDNAYNMLSNTEFSTEKAAPPTLRMADAMQTQFTTTLGGFDGAYGGMTSAASRGNIRPSVSTTYNFGFGDTDASGNYRRKFDRSTQTQTKATPFYNEIRNTRTSGGGFNFAPTRSDYQMTPARDFESRSRGSASSRYYNRFMGNYSPRG